MKNTKGCIALAIGVVLIFLGLILPFYTVSELKLSASLLFPDGISIIALIWLIFAILAVVFAFIGKKIPTIIFGILSALGMTLSFTANSSDISEYGEFVSKGLGYYFSFIGAVVMLLAVVFYAITTKKVQE